jgi:hypothetical protein
MSAESTGNPAHGQISPAKLSHAVLHTTRLKKMVEWDKAMLNAKSRGTPCALAHIVALGLIGWGISRIGDLDIDL